MRELKVKPFFTYQIPERKKMMCYGDYLKEVGYTLKKVGIRFEIV